MQGISVVTVRCSKIKLYPNGMMDSGFAENGF